MHTTSTLLTLPCSTVCPAPALLPPVQAQVAECKFLHNRLVDVVNFMENIAVKDGIEKDSFFKKLPSILPSIPPAVAIRKVVDHAALALIFLVTTR